MSKKKTATERFEIRCMEAIGGLAPVPTMEEFISLRNQLQHIQPHCAQRIRVAFRATIKARIVTRLGWYDSKPITN